MESNKKKGRGAPLILLAGIFWGSMGIFVRSLNAYGFGSVQIVCLRMTVAALLFALLLLLRGRGGFRIALRDVPLFIGLGLMSVLFFTVCYFRAIEIMPLSQASGMIRSISFGETPELMGIVILLVYLMILGAISVFFVYRKKNL